MHKSQMFFLKGSLVFSCRVAGCMPVPLVSFGDLATGSPSLYPIADLDGHYYYIIASKKLQNRMKNDPG